MKSLKSIFLPTTAIFATLAMATAAVAAPVGAPVKWSQPPALQDGFDVPSSAFGEGPWDQWVADDWRCPDGLPVTDIHWWGSWFNPPNGDMVVPSHWLFQIYSDVPVGDPDNSRPFSHPGVELWRWHTLAFAGANEQDTGVADRFGSEVFQYNAKIPRDLWFDQQQGQIYWLKIALDFLQAPPNSWGWHMSSQQWNDDAVGITINDAGNWVYAPLVDQENNFRSIDMAFELTTVPEPLSALLVASGVAGLLLLRRRRG